jgi:hypothetical protein
MRPFSKIESSLAVSCKCLVSALEEEPKQHVMWYEADRGAPCFEEGCEMDSERLTVLMDAATDRLRYAPLLGFTDVKTLTLRRIIKRDLHTMQAELLATLIE